MAAVESGATSTGNATPLNTATVYIIQLTLLDIYRCVCVCVCVCVRPRIYHIIRSIPVRISPPRSTCTLLWWLSHDVL